MNQQTTLFNHSVSFSCGKTKPQTSSSTEGVAAIRRKDCNKPNMPVAVRKSKPIDAAVHEHIGCAASVVFELAVAIEAQEKRIKETLKQAAASGDLPLITKILDLWTEGPVAEVLLHLDGSASVQER